MAILVLSVYLLQGEDRNLFALVMIGIGAVIFVITYVLRVIEPIYSLRETNKLRVLLYSKMLRNY